MELRVASGALGRADADRSRPCPWSLAARARRAGRVVGFGFWPGLELLQGRLQPAPGRLVPLGDRSLQDDATLGARLAGATKRARVDQHGVETLVLESDRARVVFVLNWTSTPIDDVTVSITDGQRRSRVRALEAGVSTAVRDDDHLVVHMPLGGVEVLTFA